MNKWANETLRLVTKKNYLDRLQTIYPHQDVERDVDEKIITYLPKKTHEFIRGMN
jgi:hypothetical protein